MTLQITNGVDVIKLKYKFCIQSMSLSSRISLYMSAVASFVFKLAHACSRG